MCGIFGATHPKRYSPEKLTAALGLLKHRGPDNTGVYHDDNIFLGHTRLSILDLSEAGHQPMRLGQNVIVFNGEIYNHLEMRERFLSGCHFRSHSDTETLLVAYQKMGLDFIP